MLFTTIKKIKGYSPYFSSYQPSQTKLFAAEFLLSQIRTLRTWWPSGWAAPDGHLSSTLTSLSPTLALMMEKGTMGRRWCSKPCKGIHGSWAPLDVDRCPLAPVLIPTPPFFFLWPWFKCVVYSHRLTSPSLLSTAQNQPPGRWQIFFLIVWEHWCLELQFSFDRITVITVLLQKIP